MTVELFGKRFLTVYDHAIYRLSYDSLVPQMMGRLTPFGIASDTFDDVKASKAIRKMIREQPKYVQGWGFRDQSGTVVGHIYLMRRGGNEVLYKIRTVDAYVFAVRVFEEHRGKRYAGEMISWLMYQLYSEGIKELWLTVKKSNTSAIRAYEKLGFERVGSSKFVRVMGHNFPYRRI